MKGSCCKPGQDSSPKSKKEGEWIRYYLLREGNGREDGSNDLLLFRPRVFALLVLLLDDFFIVRIL